MNPKQHRNSTRTIGDVIHEFLDAYRLNDKLTETRIIQSWQDVAGSYINKNTQSIYINNHILYVKVYSSIIKNELNLVHDDLLDKLNTIAGKPYLSKIVFL